MEFYKNWNPTIILSGWYRLNLAQANPISNVSSKSLALNRIELRLLFNISCLYNVIQYVKVES